MSTPHFVYFNIPGPDNSEELRLSIRSLVENVSPDIEVTVIGDKPNWYRGQFFPCQKLKHNRAEPLNRTAFRDTHHKIQVAARQPEIPETFIWMMDDIFILHPTTVEDLSILRHDPWWKPGKGSEWHRMITKTHNALRAKGYPTFQCATHLPHVFEKTKLLQMFEEFNFRNSLLLFEVLYGNRWHAEATSYLGFLYRWQSNPNATQLNNHTQNVMNYVSSVWRPAVKQWLQERFPERSRFEG